ncbi:MAG: Uma2 family endonuclease [Myxococcota bacterium]|nr:Uma2 family endonuclease [Myxococcota bacterium]
MDPARKLATYDDLRRLPEDVRAEVVAGEVRVMPSPLPRHSRIARAIGRFVGGPFDDDDGFDGPGGWWILPDVDDELGPHDVVRPDVSGWRRDRLAEPWEERPIAIVPDWVCEILSPSNAKHDRLTKADLYARVDVPHYWIVDPVERLLEAFALRDGGWFRLGAFSDGDVVRVAPFEAIELDVGRLFPPA